ncbi:MAG TPA: ATP-dependent zinc metalloprotease FtsH [Bryobacteraceae bacterium]|jgi:cell division protease FtsH|nr:ATP-dependent zinc metalloprotease FtsH [Bryobacteraceae bacterium]
MQLPNSPNTPPPRRGLPGISILIYLLGLAFFLALPYFVPGASTARTVAYSDFLSEIDANHLSQVQITPTELIGMIKPAKGKEKAPPQSVMATRLPDINQTQLLNDLEAHHVKIVGKMESSHPFLSLFIAWLPFLFLLGLMGYMFWRGRQTMGQLQFGKNRAKIYDQTTRTKVTFDDVAGIDESKAELEEVVDFLKHPDKYRRLGGRIPRGVLLIGPPGTGKTLLARAVAGEAQVPFFSISGSEFVEMFVGVGAARVRELFDQAKKKSPCIVFIDELDAIGKSRSSGRGMIVSHDEREQTLNQLLVEMDGFDQNSDVIIMAATNTPEVLDPALLRPGRFDRQVVVDSPDLEGRFAILRVHAKKVKLDPKVDLHVIASRTPGMSGADLANLINEAALLAARRGAEQVQEIDLDEATDRVTLGLEKKSRVMTPEEKQRVAYHEAGHALTAISLKHTDPVHRVSIIPRTQGALGHMLQLPTQERYLMTRPQLEDQLCVMLGGRGAEYLVYDGVISTGASDDLQRATELARQMITRFGMSDRLGNMTYGLPPNQRFLRSVVGMEERDYSDRTAQVIDEEVRKLIDTSYDHMKNVLEENRPALERIVHRLIEKETLDEEDLKALLGPQATAKDSLVEVPQ